MTQDFTQALQSALQAWNQRGRFLDLSHPLLLWLLEPLGAQRGFLFTTDSDGRYRFRIARNSDGEVIKDAERWISHFVVERTLARGEPRFFEDTRQDRRFRTEGEMEGGVRTRSILAVPFQGAGQDAMLYLDTRFGGISWPKDPTAPLRQHLDVIVELFRGGLELEQAEHQRRDAERKLAKAAREVDQIETVPTPVPTVRAGLRHVDFHGFRTCSPQLLASLEDLERLAASDLSIFIEGESGTGKEVLARALHAESARKGEFVSIHCGAIPDTLVEMELFGYKKGAFTGAEQDRRGLFEIGHRGTLFLDDVEEMSQEMQLAFLRVLETGRFRPLSSRDEVEADVRVISTSQHPPDQGDPFREFRSDLYYRLAGATVRVPPLRERREDILPLTQWFLQQFAGDVKPPTISTDVETALLSHDWPGNVRELQNLVRRVLALGDSELTLARFREITSATVHVVESTDSGTNMQSIVDRAEREAIIRALLQSGGNKSRAAKSLGLSRKTLYRRMQKHGIPL